MKNNETCAISELIGLEVRNEKGETLGTIHDFVLNCTKGKIVYAVLTFGGLLGMGNKLFAVPLNLMKLDGSHGHFVLNLDRNVMESQPGFDKDNWPDFRGKNKTNIVLSASKVF